MTAIEVFPTPPFREVIVITPIGRYSFTKSSLYGFTTSWKAVTRSHPLKGMGFPCS